MGSEVADSVEKPVGVLLHITEIGGVEVPAFHIFPQASHVLPVGVCGLVVHRQEQVDVVQHFLVGQLGFGQAGKLHPQLAHVLLRQEQGVVGLIHLPGQVAHMDGRPHPLGRSQCQVQGVLAHHPDGGHGHLDGPAAVVGVAEHQVGLHLVPLDDVPVGELGQQPDLPAVLQGTGCFVLHPLPQQRVGKGKGFGVLYHTITVGDYPQHLVVGIPKICFIAWDGDVPGGHDGLLDYLPIQAGQSQRLIGTERRFHPDAQAMPRGLTDIKHGFHISCHCTYLLLS